MKKNIVQDVVPPRKSIRNIRLSGKKEIERPSHKEQKRDEDIQGEDFTRSVPISAPVKIVKEEPESKNPDFLSYKYEFEEKKPRSKKWLYASVFILLLASAFGVTALFKSAEIKVSPKTESKIVDEIFSAKKDAVSGLGYQTVTISKEVEKTAKATGEEKMERKSTGRIIIYNNFSTTEQKLVATTRFQTPEGLIYRLVEPATVPGQTVKDGKTTAGSVEVSVTADKAGVSYNIGLKDFTIPGFKGDPKYTSVYARSKTEMTGGFSGMQKTVSKEALSQEEIAMTDSLKTALFNEIKAQIPANFISYDAGTTYQYDPIVQVEGATSADVLLKKKGRATAVIFDKNVLTKSILTKSMPEISNDSVRISNLDTLTFKTATTTADTVNFVLSGNANFVWTFDENKLKTDLLGLSKKSALTVIESYPSINEAWVETKPFWNQKIPKDPNNVDLVNTEVTN